MGNSSKKEKYPDIEYVLHIYDTIWDYYKKTLDERTQILNNYIVFVGIPISVVGIIAERLGENIIYYFKEIICILFLIVLIGIVIFYMYIKESAVSKRYMKRITLITEYMIRKYDSKSCGLFKSLYGLDDLFHQDSVDRNTRLGKGLIVPIVNSGIVAGIFYFMTIYQINWMKIFGVFIISLVAHMLLFMACYKAF